MVKGLTTSVQDMSAGLLTEHVSCQGRQLSAPTFRTRVVKEVPSEASQEVEDLPVSHGLVPVLGDEALSKALALPEGHQVNEVSPEAADGSAAQQQLAGGDVGEQLQENVLRQFVDIAYSHGSGFWPAPVGVRELR